MSPQETNNDIVYVRKASAIIDAFRAIEPGMPSAYLATFLAVAEDPGHGPVHYAKHLGFEHPQVVSRILLELGQKSYRRESGEGLGLLESDRDADDLRSYNYKLTASGRKLLGVILKVMKQ